MVRARPGNPWGIAARARANWLFWAGKLGILSCIFLQLAWLGRAGHRWRRNFPVQRSSEENHPEDTCSGQSGWLTAARSEAASALHLVVVWSRHEAERVAEVCAVTRAALLGRGSEIEAGDPPKLELVRQRPSGNEGSGALRSPKLSRRQWLIEPKGEHTLFVRNVGQRALLHNGRACSECHAEPGDTLSTDGVLTCLVERRPKVLAGPARADFPFGAADADGIVGESPAAWLLRAVLHEVSASNAHVLILGESGAGKELCANAIHRRAGRDSVLIARNAATIPGSLVEAELFGTAANFPNPGTPARKGLVGAAHGGTLFLDEIAELAERQQANLLRVLDAGEYQRLGEDAQRKSCFRLLAATNLAPDSLKHDFLARFAERVALPGLNQRRADIPLLIRHLLPQVGLSEQALHPNLIDALLRHRYTHHFRELDRLLRLARRTSAADRLELTAEVEAELDLPLPTQAPTAQEIRKALSAGGSLTETAARLGLPSRYALYRLLKKHGIATTEEA